MNRTLKFDLSNSKWVNRYSDELSLFPRIEPKFNDDSISINGSILNYDDIGKIRIILKDNVNTIEPYYFMTDKTDGGKILDYSLVYAIGAIEILNLFLIDCPEFINDFNSVLLKNLDIFDSYEEIQELLDILALNDSIEDDSKWYYEPFNIALALKTKYSNRCYNILKEMMAVLMIVWTKDKRRYWTIIFELLNVCKFHTTHLIFEDLGTDIIAKVAKRHYKLSDDDEYIISADIFKNLRCVDTLFEQIEYDVPDKKDMTRNISDCRGIVILLTYKFYIQLLLKFGSVNSDSVKFTNDHLNELDNKIQNCFGNDSCSKALRGIRVNEEVKIDENGCYIWNYDHRMKYDFGTCAIYKDIYEDYILFEIAYGVQHLNPDMAYNYRNDICMNFVTQTSLRNAVGFMLSFMGFDFYALSSEEYDKQMDYIDSLKNKNTQLMNTLTNIKSDLCVLYDNYVGIEEYNNLEKVNAKLKESLVEKDNIINSKNTIIEKLTTELKELNAKISSFYCEEDEEDLEDETTDENISIEDMIKELNQFKFCLVGGRMELLSKLEELGWTNTIQIDKSNRRKCNLSMPQSDFYVINTAFLSHNLVAQVEKNEDISDTKIYYNGTNVEKLIKSCYDFLQKYFE